MRERRTLIPTNLVSGRECHNSIVGIPMRWIRCAIVQAITEIFDLHTDAVRTYSFLRHNPTQGMLVSRFMENHFPDLVDPTFTSKLEDALGITQPLPDASCSARTMRRKICFNVNGVNYKHEI